MNTVFVTIFILFIFTSNTSAIWNIGQVFLTDTSSPHRPLNYQVYWNVPTFMCQQYGIYFNEVSSNFGMIQNYNDTFRGSKIAILYDPGIFPALLKIPNGSIQIRNGGVPQEGNLQLHLNHFAENVEEQIVKNFSGIGIIDFESWRPIFRQNWGSLAQYRDYSYEIEEARYPFFNANTIKGLATKRFENYGRIFMKETIKLAQELRPKAAWGYYGFPQCFNLTPKQPNSQCDNQLRKDNDELQWLWDQEKVLLPSVYLPFNFDTNKKVELINGRLNEAWRIAKKHNPRPKIYPYFWYKYRDQQNIFLNYDDIARGFEEMLRQKIDGHIIWGSSNDVNTREKCYELKNYLNNILGPLVKNLLNVANERTVNYDNSTNILK